MTWYMNFCAPFMPNDPTINFHRFFQIAILAVYTLLYGIVHAYYMWCGPMPLSNKEPPSTYPSSQPPADSMRRSPKIHPTIPRARSFLSS